MAQDDITLRAVVSIVLRSKWNECQVSCLMHVSLRQCAELCIDHLIMHSCEEGIMYCCYSVLHNVRETGAGYNTSHSDVACTLVSKTVQYMVTSVCCDSTRALQHNVLCGGKKTWGERWGLTYTLAQCAGFA